MDELESNIFPRELTDFEKELLFFVLPENKPGYKAYREKINNLVVSGSGRFESSTLILSPSGTLPDMDASASQVFALGTVEYENNLAEIVIQEELDSQIEFDIAFNRQPSESLKEIRRWTYSEWVPGKKAPGDNLAIREIEIKKGKFILAVAPDHKKIWLYDYRTGINLIIPVTNVYNYLMLVKNIRIADKVFKPSLFFSELKSFSDDEIISAFLAYNKYFNKVKIDI